MVWDKEQEREAKQKTDEQLAHAVSQELQGTVYLLLAHSYEIP